MRDEQSRKSGADALRDLMTSENELLRCAALQAYARQENDPDALRATLLDALMDPDPDLRADAMEALADIAVETDLPAIRHSLTGDPVREVKQAAIRAMGRIGTATDKALLRGLVLSRCDDTVAWEDALGDWEEWLDIQVMAIDALGRLSDTDSIEDLFEARDDPNGQNLDTPVFDALGQMGNLGVSWLLAVVKTGNGLARKRAADTLARLAPETLVDHIDILLEQDGPALRLHAVGALTEEDKRLAELALHDSDPAVRRFALQKAVACDPTLALQGLKDKYAGVQAAALDMLTLPPDQVQADAIADNLCAWMSAAKPALLTAAARNVARLVPDRAEDLLAELAGDESKPLEARVVAVRALSALEPSVPIERLTALLSNPSQQVRLAATLALRDCADPVAHEVLADAAEQTYLSKEAAVVQRATDKNGPEVGAPKEGSTGQSKIRITAEGEIVPAEKTPEQQVSTLSSILAGAEGVSEPAEMAEDTPEDSAPKRKKRRAVEGPDKVAKSLALDVLRNCADLAGDKMGPAIIAQMQCDDDDVRRIAWKAASTRFSAGLDADLFQKPAQAALEDPDPQIQFHAFDMLDFGKDDSDVRAMALKCSDGLTRASAVRQLPANEALDYLSDSEALVRKAAAAVLLETPTPSNLNRAVSTLSDAKWINTLSYLLEQAQPAREFVLSELSSGNVSDQKAYIYLRALAGAPV